jgi:hypothetical protein
MTQRTFDLSIPIPNAIVAQTTWHSSLMKSSWFVIELQCQNQRDMLLHLRLFLSFPASSSVVFLLRQ